VTDEHTEGEGELPKKGQDASHFGGGKVTAGQVTSNADPSTPADALTSLSAAFLKAAETKPATTADPNISAAFALGWHMSELYERHLPADKRKPVDLPGLGELRKQQPLALVVNQAEVGVKALDSLITKAGLDPIDLNDIRGLSERKRSNDPVLATHGQLLTELTAADPRIGKAYGLGRALADSCHEPDDLEGLKKELSPYRIANLLRWLDDLASALPAHAAQSVATSLERWRDALYPPTDGRVQISRNPLESLRSWQARRRRTSALDATDVKEVDDVVKALRRQGELWRSLLSGEKQGQDMLEVDNYLDAGRQLLSQTAAIIRGLVRRMPLLVSAVAVLVGGGIWLLSKGNSGHLVAGATSVLAGLGLTWKGLGSTLGQLAGKLEQPLWGAALDHAIADAVTLLPNNKAATGARREVARTLAAGPGTEDQDPKQSNGS
jgi:hypothetical protein